MSEMNRRSFLEMVGMVGGSTALYQVMTSMGLAQASPQQMPELQGSGQGKSVLILGAGLAGMASAYELRRAGYDVRILEYNAVAGAAAGPCAAATSTPSWAASSNGSSSTGGCT